MHIVSISYKSSSSQLFKSLLINKLNISHGEGLLGFALGYPGLVPPFALMLTTLINVFGTIFLAPFEALPHDGPTPVVPVWILDPPSWSASNRFPLWLTTTTPTLVFGHLSTVFESQL